MNKKDKGEMTTLITDALNDVVIPALENMEQELRNDLASKREIQSLRSRFAPA